MKATFRVELENLTSKQSTKNGILVFDKDDMIVSRDVVLSLLICMYGVCMEKPFNRGRGYDLYVGRNHSMVWGYDLYVGRNHVMVGGGDMIVSHDVCVA